MRKLFNLTMFLGLLIIASCSSENDLRDNPLLLSGQVKFQSTIGAEVSTRVTGTNWDQGDAIGVYALNAGSEMPGGIYSKANARFTTPDAGALAQFTAATADDQIAYPKDGSKLDFVAYYPYTAQVTDYKLPIDVSVQTNSAAIDYLYTDNVKGKNVADQTANLNFKHKLSQLILNVSLAGFESNSGLTATIKGLKVDGSLNLKDGTVDAGETDGDITPLFNSAKTTATAILVPNQNLQNATVEFTLNGLTFKWTPESQLIETGKKYSYNLKLTHEGVVLVNPGATITDWEDGYIGTDDIILEPEGEGGGEPTTPESSLLFPGSDFEDWDAFLGGLTTHGLKPGYTTQSNDGRNGSKAMYLNGTPSGNDFVFTATVPEGFNPIGKNKIVFWIKGNSAKSLSLNVYKGGTSYQAFNLGVYNAERVIAPASNNQYTGTIDTGGEWMKVVVDISSVDLASTVGESLFAIKVGKDAAYDLLIDDITIEGEGGIVEKTLKTDKTSLSLGADDNLSGTINLTSTEAWTATSNAAWLTASPASGTGNKAVVVTAQKNETETPRSATVTFKADGVADVVVSVTQAAAAVVSNNLLFPGSDFNNWATFTSSLNSFGLTFGKESAAGGRGGSGAMLFEGQHGSNAYVFTVKVPEGFSAAGKSKINFWIKGTAVKSLSLNVYVGTGGVMGTDYKCYNMDEHVPYNSHKVLAPTAANSYAKGGIDTNGEWIQVSLDISTIVSQINSTSGQDLFALKVGSKADYNLLIDDITIE